MCKVALKPPRGARLSGNKWKHFYISLLVPGTQVGPRLHSSNGIENAHESQSSRENATSSHGTAPLASTSWGGPTHFLREKPWGRGCISLLLGSSLREKPKTVSTSSPTTKSSINLHPELRKTQQSLHVRESETVLDSVSHAVDSGFQSSTSRFLSLELGFRIPVVTGIPDSLSCIADSEAQGSGFQKHKLLDSGFQKQKFPESTFPYMVQK